MSDNSNLQQATVISKSEKPHHCDGCGLWQEKDNKFCIECGAKMHPHTWIVIEWKDLGEELEIFIYCKCEGKRAKTVLEKNERMEMNFWSDYHE